MTDKLQQIAKEEIEKLPKENREAINSLDWSKLTEEIGVRFTLDEEEINDLQVEVLLALTGIQDAAFFPTYVENNVGLTKEEAENISEEIFKSIFLPVETKIEEAVKEKTEQSDAAWHQNIDFIISGGNYTAFTENNKTENT